MTRTTMTMADIRAKLYAIAREAADAADAAYRVNIHRTLSLYFVPACGAEWGRLIVSPDDVEDDAVPAGSEVVRHRNWSAGWIPRSNSAATNAAEILECLNRLPCLPSE